MKSAPIEIELQQDYPPIEPQPKAMWWRWQLVRAGKILGKGWTRTRVDSYQAASNARKSMIRNVSPNSDKDFRIKAHSEIMKSALGSAGE